MAPRKPAPKAKAAAKKPAAKVAPKAVKAPVKKPVAKPAAKPVAKAVSKPAVKPVVKPVSKPAVVVRPAPRAEKGQDVLDYLRSYALENPAMAVVGLVALLLVLLLVVG